ncbi:MAG: DUF3788 family protein [Clostridiales bacterium]|jgi:hypothetical protein|nr:DUF3788 family protein [Clostridiales bacterium]
MANKKRLNDKAIHPTQEFVRDFMGDNAWQRLMRFEDMLRQRYNLGVEMKFPFGNEYGWGFRYSHNKSLLLHTFFEQDGFCATISINDRGADKVAGMLSDSLPKTQELWKNRYPCGKNGGWIHYSVESDEELLDVVRLVSVKVKPLKIV